MDFSKQVEGQSPIIAERAVLLWAWMPSGGACDEFHRPWQAPVTFYLFHGQAGSDVVSRALVQNLKDEALDFCHNRLYKV